MARKIHYRRLRRDQVIGYQGVNELYDNDRRLDEDLRKLEGSAVTQQDLDEAIQGVELEPGPPGDTPHIGGNGNWWIGTTDTGIQAQGPKGDPGASPVIGGDGYWWVDGVSTGVLARGPEGTPGTTPHIGGNGNWWVGLVDLGVPARGPPGEPGSGQRMVSAYYEWDGSKWNRTRGDEDFLASAVAQGAGIIELKWTTPREFARLVVTPSLGVGSSKPLFVSPEYIDATSAMLHAVDTSGSPDDPVFFSVFLDG